MTLSIIRLGTSRQPDEGLRIGIVRRPPRGVPKSDYASGNWFDVWYPNLAPSSETMKLGQGAEDEKSWQLFVRRYKAELNTPEARHNLALLAALSHSGNLAIGCYCEHESRCHRSVLREVLLALGAALA
ncbi:hypothetical protein G114_04536 [Aeromonas diversa CDC 2478-85]|uniref:DUF488 domain-containing protein n=1 Tax=Aeromonas diversa CDC 2478-85 TaxID=1268237 RepID=N9VCP3_9GAMM|nr:DUF488 family protein [Aeromonas diversa]ENY73012.1 hypothetical protein G114_04536 [Aeromonas diversa CDC 2478-85]